MPNIGAPCPHAPAPRRKENGGWPTHKPSHRVFLPWVPKAGAQPKGTNLPSPPPPPTHPTPTRGPSPSTPKPVNPPNPPKTHKPRINNGDLYFQNLAYLPPPTNYNRDSPQTPATTTLPAPSPTLPAANPFRTILSPLTHLPATPYAPFFTPTRGILCPLTLFIAATYTQFFTPVGDTLLSNPRSFIHLHPIFTPRGGRGGTHPQPSPLAES